jgi:threonine dehydrogenase-like Zn-dependent dehydrogenase
MLPVGSLKSLVFEKTGSTYKLNQVCSDSLQPFITSLGLPALDINAERLRFCRERLGVTHTIRATDADVTEQISTITNGDMPTVVIDATGNQHSLWLPRPQWPVRTGRLAEGRYRHQPPRIPQTGSHSDEQPQRHAGRFRPRDGINEGRANYSNDLYGEVANEFASWLDPAKGVIKAMVTMGE